MEIIDLVSSSSLTKKKRKEKNHQLLILPHLSIKKEKQVNKK
jgi:hypothetical protein